MLRITPAMRVSIGLVLLTLSILLIGDMLGFIPKHDQAMLKSREKVAESLALQISSAVYAGQITNIKKTLDSIVNRDEDILSAALRQFNGRVVVHSGNHAQHWKLSEDDSSSSTHIKMPVYTDKKKWGQFEVVFTPLGASNVREVLDMPLVKLLLYASFAGFIGYLIFIKKALRELDPSQVVPTHVKATLDSLSEGVVILDENERIVLANAPFMERLKLGSEALLGRKASSLNWKLPNSSEAPPKYPWVFAVSEMERQTGIPIEFETRKGERLAFMVNSSPILDAKENLRGAMATFDDVTQLERKNSELSKALKLLRQSRDEVQQQNAELEVLATRDPLTGCLNRRAFFQLMEQAYDDAKEQGHELSAIMADIDFFKLINDNHGHARGDDILKKVSELMSSCLRTDDRIGRYGGEEFCIFLPGVGIKQAGGLAERIRQRIENSDFGVDITCSFGVSSLSWGANSSADVLNQADEALYLSKETGRNRVTRYDKKEEIENWLTLKQENDKNFLRESRLLGLPDLSGLYRKLKNRLAEAHKHDAPVAVLMLNLDRFKGIVHTLGQTVSSELLTIIEQRLSDALRQDDIIEQLDTKTGISSVERINSEEFVIILSQLRDIEQVGKISRRLMDEIAKPVTVDNVEILVTSSMGISIFPEHSDHPEDLVNKAAMALFEASRNGRNHMQFYSEDIKHAATEAVMLESKLSKAIENDEFHIVYQPRLDLKTNSISSMEALLRWKHPELGSVSPVMFIPLAEDSGIIIEIGEWVLRNVCKQIKTWREEELLNFRVSINLSTKQLLDSKLAEKLNIIMIETGVEPGWIELEITETAIMENLELSLATLSELKEMGIHLSIDDFGTGYSSLSYLKHFPVDSLKIDRAFVADIATDSHDQMLVATIAEMAHQFGLDVVAEGVESREQLEKLLHYQCDEIQGYIFSKPLAPEKTVELIHSTREQESITLTDGQLLNPSRPSKTY